jgi:type I restriction enzyme S subunit
MTETMKDSGQEWIGAIPESWDTNRICYCLNEINVKNSPVKTEQILSLVKDKGVMLYEEKGDVGNKAKEDITGYKVAFPNTLIVNSMNILIGSVGISKYKGCVSPVYYVFREKDNSDLRFVNYIFNTREFQKELRKYANGILEIRLRVSATDIFNRKIPLPPKEEQIKIADFLDEKCAEIDKLSEDIQKQIDILNDYKKSVITRAVTKGLNPNVKKKDSGQLHIGDIPEEWEIVRVKDVFKMQSGFTPDSKRTDYYDDVNGFNWVTIADINKKSDLPETTKSKISKKYIEAFHPRMAKAGSLLYSFKLSIGQVAFVKKDTYTNEAIISFSCKDTRNLRFLKYSSSLIEYNANTNIYGSKILNQQLIGNAHITLPPIDEQDHIADYLDDFTAKMSDIIDEKNNQLEKIDLYKKSIIYEYVTGKKRVKGAL